MKDARKNTTSQLVRSTFVPVSIIEVGICD